MKPGTVIFGMLPADSRDALMLHPGIVLDLPARPGWAWVVVGTSRRVHGASGPEVVCLNPGEPGFADTGLESPTAFTMVAMVEERVVRSARRLGKIRSPLHVARVRVMEERARRLL